MRIFRDFYGCTSMITSSRDGGVNMKIRTAGGKLIHSKHYGSERGARIAMRRMSEEWNEVTIK